MDDQIGSRHNSLDDLIEWLHNQRTRHPSAPFAALLAERTIDAAHLVELACIDLIEQRRLGNPVRTEDYAAPFPQLQRDDRLLDLIDAEICVTSELQQPIDLGEYQRRFPRLSKQIEELFGLEPLQASNGPDVPHRDEPRLDPSALRRDQHTRRPASTHDEDSLDPSASFTVELAVAGDREANDALPMIAGHPLHAPDWFSAEKCFASGPGRWLIRGRDSLRGDVMAMKVVRLSPRPLASISHQILDACEAASKVRNPMWVAPMVAAIQHDHLGAIRPWVFGVPWITVATKREIASQLGDLASIAYCIESAHRVHATHGAIHCENVLLDHDGKLRIVDAVANRDGMRRWLDEVDATLREPSILSLRCRKQTDTEDLIRLIASVSASWRQPWAGQLISEVTMIADRELEEAGGTIGEVLMKYADAPPQVSTSKSGSWRNVWKRWLDKS